MSRPEPYAPATPASGAANTPGRIAVVLAAVALAIGVAQQILVVFAPLLAYQAGAPTSQIAGLFGLVGAIHLVLSIGAVIFGAVGVTKRALGHSPVWPAIALGAGAVGVVSGIVGFAVVPLVAAVV